MSVRSARAASKRDGVPTEYIPSLMLDTGELQVNPEKTTQMLYKIKLPSKWELDGSELSIAAGRGMSAFAHKLYKVRSGPGFVVLVRPLDSFVPDKDCVTTNETSDCMGLTTAEYESQLEQIQTAYAVLKPLGATPTLYYNLILPGTTENYVDDRFYADEFGVQVWEAWHMSLQDYVLNYNVTTARFRANILPLLVRKCNQIGEHNMFLNDLHYGNVVVNVDKRKQEVVDIAFIDLAEVRVAEHKVICDEEEFMEVLAEMRESAAEGLLHVNTVEPSSTRKRSRATGSGGVTGFTVDSTL